MCSGCMWRGTRHGERLCALCLCLFLASSLRNEKICGGVRDHTLSPPWHHTVYVVG
uniref:Uncharacterized protein n=1 Tax=Oryza meridionalis TaxID=40149 RepID=A0A0E0FA04_9ORYZ